MLSDNRNRYDKTMTYDNNGNVTKLHRCGKMQKGTYGNVDKLTTMEYSGNQLTARHYHHQRDVVASRDVGASPAIKELSRLSLLSSLYQNTLSPVAGETPTSPVTA